MRRVLCTLQRATTRPGAGRDWQTLDTVWVELKALRAVQYFRAGTEEVMVTHTARLRYRADIHIGDRFLYGTRAHEIVHVVDPDMRQRRLICQCRTRHVPTPIAEAESE